jgi:hypothetical protein
LIINELSFKTHETTGKKPAKLEMKNKPNINLPQHTINGKKTNKNRAVTDGSRA